MISLSLPFPPSMNTYWRNVNGRTLLSAKGRRYKVEVIAAVYEQLKRKPQPLAGDIAVKIEFYPPDNRKRDMDNYYKALFDSLTTAGAWEDDSQIKHIESDWINTIKNGSVIIYINVIKSKTDQL